MFLKYSLFRFKSSFFFTIMFASFRHMKFLNSSIINKNLIQALNNKYQLIPTRNKNTFISREHFEVRHNGINQKDQEEMLKVVNVKVNLIKCFFLLL